MPRRPDMREWTCVTLAALFDRVPDRFEAMPGTGCELAAPACALVRALGATPRVATEADQVRLFVTARGGVPAPPYASWYLDGQLLGPSTSWVVDFYARQGLEPAAGAGVPPDALGPELELLAFLGRHERAAIATGDGAALALLLDAQRTFLADHFSRWVPLFVQTARASAPGLVFTAAIDLLDAWLRVESLRLNVGGHASKSPLKKRR